MAQDRLGRINSLVEIGDSFAIKVPSEWSTFAAESLMSAALVVSMFFASSPEPRPENKEAIEKLASVQARFEEAASALAAAAPEEWEALMEARSEYAKTIEIPKGSVG